MISDIVEGRVPSGCEVDPELGAEDLKLIHAAALAYGCGDERAAARALAPMAERHPDWSAPWLVDARNEMSDEAP